MNAMQTLFTYAQAKSLAVAAAALLAVLALRWAWCVVCAERRRRGLARFLFGAALSLIVVCHVGGKTNSPPRGAAGGDVRVPVESPRSFGADVTNLAFTAISVASNAVSLDAAWPQGQLSDGAALDLFVKPRSWTNDWLWTLSHTVAQGETNAHFTVALADFASGTNLPGAMFFLLRDRASCASTMADADGDGLPDVYELHNGTNPYVADAALAPRLAVGGESTNTLRSALAASSPYSIISVAPGEYETSAPIYMPPHPVMLVAEGGYAVVRSTATSPGVFVLDSGQDGHTLFRGLYVVLATQAQGTYQAAFWCGGSLPWAGTAASATFEDVRIRALYPGVRHYGWHFYRYRPDAVSISNCTVNAAGSTDICGVYSYDGPPMEVRSCTFANFPLHSAVYLQTSSGNVGGMSAEAEVLIEGSTFDMSFEGAWPLARFEYGTNFVVSMSRCIVPSDLLAPHEPDFSEGICVTNAGVAWCGIAPPGSPAADMEIGSVATTALGPAADADGDGLSDHDEAFVLGTDPWLRDSDGDGIPDGDELAHGTSPTDLGSFFRQVTAVLDCEAAPAGVTNFVAWGLSAAGWETNAVAFACGGVATNVFEVATTNETVYVKAYCDLDGSGAFEADRDVLLVREVPPFPATSRFVFRFGDVDGDGVSDAQERQDGTDPYDKLNFRVSANVSVTLSDAADSVTNYIEWGGAGSASFVSGPLTLYVEDTVTNGVLTVRCWRDLDRDGTFSEAADAVYERLIAVPCPPGAVVIAVGDADGDGVFDSEEAAEGTSPNDARSCCFSMLAHVTGVFATTNSLVAVALFGTNVVSGPVSVATNEWTVDFGHLSTTNGERAAVRFWDDADGDGELGPAEPSTGLTLLPNGHWNAVTNRLPLGGFDIDADGIADYWEELHSGAGLSPTNAADALFDPDGDGLVNLHEYWADCDPLAYDGTNTALYAAVWAIDGRLTATNSEGRMRYYTQVGPDAIVANTNCWAADIPLGSQSPYNSSAGLFRSGTVISERHIVFAAHFPIPEGASLYFHASDGHVLTNSLAASVNVAGDIQLGILSNIVDTNFVHIAKVLPDDYASYVGTGKFLPALLLNRHDDCLVEEISDLTAKEMRLNRIVSGLRSSYSGKVFTNDSGNPAYIVFGNEPVLLFELHGGYGGDGVNGYVGMGGPALHMHKTMIQDAMDELCNQFSFPGCSLQEIDLSVYSRLPNER